MKRFMILASLLALAGPASAQTTQNNIQLMNPFYNSVQLKPSTTVAKLPTCNAAESGTSILVTDASSPTYNGTLTGSSTAIVIALCNGTNWTAH